MNDFENENHATDETAASHETHKEPVIEVEAVPVEETPPDGGYKAPVGGQYYGTGYTRPYAPNGAYNPNVVQPGAPVPPKPPKKKSKGMKAFLITFIVVAVLAVVGIVVSLLVSDEQKPGAQESNTNAPSIEMGSSPAEDVTTPEGELTGVGVNEKIHNISVGVLTYSGRNGELSGQGSGVIVGEDKTGKYTYIVTCAHVIDANGVTVRVQLNNEKQYDADIVGFDTKTDIGVLRIQASGLPKATLGDSDSLKVGQKVYAIGNPGGVAFFGSLTGGIVSAIGRPVSSSIGYELLCIQHDAAINPGNSGGALVNAYGQVVGINSSKIANTSYEGMGFAVPSKTVKTVFDEIVKNGYVTNRAKLGIKYTSVASSQMYSMLVQMKGLPAGSLIVQSIDKDSNLVGTALRQGDLIIGVNGKRLDTAKILPDVMDKASVGDKIKLTICRVDEHYNTSEYELEVALVEDKGASASAETATEQNGFYNPFG